MDLYELLQGHIAVFLLMLVRVSGIFLISPFFGSMNISIYFRVGTALAITILLFPVVDGLGTPYVPENVIMFGVTALGELFVGWLIGFVAYISFAAITMAGKVMDMQVGFAIVNVVDPTSGQQIPLIGSFLYNLAVIVLLATNGHHMILAALVESFGDAHGKLHGHNFPHGNEDRHADHLRHSSHECGARHPLAYDAADEHLCCRHSDAADDRHHRSLDDHSVLCLIPGCAVQ